jgi:hypothetical protein
VPFTAHGYIFCRTRTGYLKIVWTAFSPWNLNGRNRVARWRSGIQWHKFMSKQWYTVRSAFVIVSLYTSRQTDTHSVGLLWTSDQPVAEAATYTAHNKQRRRASMSSAGFEPAILASKRPQTYTLDNRAIGTDSLQFKVSHSEALTDVRNMDQYHIQLRSSLNQGCGVGTQNLRLRLLSF